MALEAEEITPDKKIILYDSNRRDARIVADYLVKAGFPEIYYFDLTSYQGDLILGEE